MSLLESSDVELLGVGELVKWLSKQPEPSATQTHEPLRRCHGAESEGAIELADELAESPT